MVGRTFVTLASVVSLISTGCLPGGAPPPLAPLGATFQDQPRVVELSGVVEAPADLALSLFVVDVQINGQGPFRMLLDTGSAATLVTPAVAERFPLSFDPAGGGLVIDALGQAGQTGRLVIDQLVLGAAVFEQFDARVVELPDFGVPVDGILGMPLFAELLLELDYEASAVRISRGTLGPVDGCTIQPLINDGGRPAIALGLGDETFVATLDSGFNRTIGLPTAIADGVAFEGPLEVVGSATTLLGTSESLRGDLVEPATIGCVEFDGLVRVGELNSVLVGALLLADLGPVTFDLASERVRFGAALD